ncbi:hypothetical protein CEXT_605631 [Caerostris extrusa]|uniref:Uncharacterized protein n=1 Tax=Caerostris extrusa TaxID=172846 RepID=A0AAV4Y2Z4_CAEEX|nr:hypothetical protein CEXT_605631 [Caerostris extrusa]
MPKNSAALKTFDACVKVEYDNTFELSTPLPRKKKHLWEQKGVALARLLLRKKEENGKKQEQKFRKKKTNTGTVTGELGKGVACICPLRCHGDILVFHGFN